MEAARNFEKTHMSDPDLRNVIQAAQLLADYERPWAVCGGWAIDLYLNQVTRAHKDVDFAVLRKDQLLIQEYLLSRDWTLEKTVHAQLVPWPTGEWIDLPVHVIWCKNPKASPDFIELFFNEVDEVNFLFRRDTSIKLPIEKWIQASALEIPFLAPGIVLLYKSTKPEDPAAADFKNVLPTLSSERRSWLAAALEKLYPNHIWLKDLP